jgi:hypothetical protein
MDFEIFGVFDMYMILIIRKDFCITHVPLISLFTLKHIYAFQPMDPCSNMGICILIALGYKLLFWLIF